MQSLERAFCFGMNDPSRAKAAAVALYGDSSSNKGKAVYLT